MDEKRKIRLFRAIAVLLPFVLLIFLETGLRIGRYGSNLDDLFLTTDDGKYYYINKDITKRYFRKGQATTGNAEFFKTQKDLNTMRLFVIGESAALGFPYPNNISFSRMLKYALKNTYPDKDIEVINLSFSAINSYTFYDFGRKLPAYSPDAILIYGGHNEYYGAMGVASTSGWGTSPGFVRFMISLKRLRLYQLAESLIYSLRGSSDGVLMQQVVNDQQIEYQGDIYKKGIRQYKTNMEALLGLLSEKSIPVFLSTVPTNLKDLKPFESCGRDNETSADVHFNKGKQEYAREDFQSALNSFRKAQQYDCLRFRAPEEINELIRHLTNSYPHLKLVDSEKAFYSRSANGIPGNELLLEHVHPNIEGHKDIARLFYNEIISSDLFEKPLAVNSDSLLMNYPVLAFDSLAGLYAYNKLIRGFPFYMDADEMKITSDMEKMAMDYTITKNWYQSMDGLYKYAIKQKKYSLALEILRVRIIDNQYDPEFYFPAGEISMLIGDYPVAIRYYEKGFSLQPSFETARSIIVSSLQNDDPEKAFKYIDYAIENNTGSINFMELKPYIETLIRFKKELGVTQNTAQRQNISSSIASVYEKIGNKEAANKYR